MGAVPMLVSIAVIAEGVSCDNIYVMITSDWMLCRQCGVTLTQIQPPMCPIVYIPGSLDKVASGQCTTVSSPQASLTDAHTWSMVVSCNE